MTENEDYTLVSIEWFDAWFDFVVSDTDNIYEEYIVQTVGFLINNGVRALSIAQEILPNDDGFRAVTHIPKGVIEPGGLTKLSGPVLDENLMGFTQAPLNLEGVNGDAVIWPADAS